MLILASKSPRRIEMIKKWNIPFKIIPSDIDEDLYPLDQISYQKAIKISSSNPDDTVISADTVVILNDQVLGKPNDENDAYKMLKSLSNKTHQVVTSFCIINHNKNIIIRDKVTSFVTFNQLDEKLIFDYINSKSPLDKAGAYGIQDNDKFPIIQELKGSLDNVIGFPQDEIKELLHKNNLI